MGKILIYKTGKCIYLVSSLKFVQYKIQAENDLRISFETVKIQAQWQ